MSMSENATHIIVHHYIHGTSIMHPIMIFCLILFVIIGLVVIILLGIVIYIAVSLKKTQRSTNDRSLKPITRQRVRHLEKNMIEDSSTYNDGELSVSTQEFDAGTDFNAQTIPLKTFRTHTMQNNRISDSSESSAGLYDVLFPIKHEADINEPPNKLITYAGQVYASGESSSPTKLITRPSPSGVTCDDATACESLEWDYFQQDRRTGSVYSENESVPEPGQVYALGESSSQTDLIAGPSTSGVTCDNATACGSLRWNFFHQDRHTGSVYSENESVTSSEPKQIQSVCWV